MNFLLTLLVTLIMYFIAFIITEYLYRIKKVKLKTPKDAEDLLLRIINNERTVRILSYICATLIFMVVTIFCKII